MSERFVYRPDHPMGPNVIDCRTGRWMSLDLAKEYAAVVNAAVKKERAAERRRARAAATPKGGAHD